MGECRSQKVGMEMAVGDDQTGGKIQWIFADEKKVYQVSGRHNFSCVF